MDVETWGWLGFPGDRRLLLSCGFRRAQDTFSRVLGTAGQIRITNPFHPRPGDRFGVRAAGRDPVGNPAQGRTSTHSPPRSGTSRPSSAGRESPRWLAAGTSLGSARALADLTASARR